MPKKKKKKIIWLVFILLIVILILVWVFFPKEEKTEYQTEVIKRGDLIQVINEVGTVKSSQEIKLNFLRAGRLNKKNVVIGQTVIAGQVLAELDCQSLEIQKQEAQASLEVAQASLRKLLQGATESEKAVQQAAVNQAQALYNSAIAEKEKTEATVEEAIAQAQGSLDDLTEINDVVTTYEKAVSTAVVNLNNTKNTYQQTLDNKIDSALSALQNNLAVANTALDNIDTIISDDDLDNLFSAQNTNYSRQTESTYNSSLDLLEQAQDNLNLAIVDKEQSSVSDTLASGLLVLDEVFSSLSNCYKGLENSITSSYLTSTSLEALKTTISGQQTLVSSSISGLESAQQNLNQAILNYSVYVSQAEDSLEQAQVSLDEAIRQAENSLTSAQRSGEQQIVISQSKVSSAYEAWQLAKKQLEQLKAPARLEDVSLAEGQIKQSQAAIDLINQQTEDCFLKSPIEGQVTDFQFEIGEQISVGQPVATILGGDGLQAEIDISETDISKIKVGNPVIMTFDAFDEDFKLQGIVQFIEPDKTIIQNVIYYTVEIIFKADQNLVNLKPGMTVNATITTAEKKDIILAPSRSIIDKNGEGKFIRLLKNGQLLETPVEVGIKGEGNLMEILSGAEENDVAITYIKK